MTVLRALPLRATFHYSGMSTAMDWNPLIRLEAWRPEVC
jgi:hypothetical protein